MAKLPPQPVGVPFGHSFWNDWIEKLRNVINNPGNHNDLNNIQGGNSTERYHLTSAQATNVTDLATTTSFTPSAAGTTTGGTGTYTTQLGYYKKVGDLVHFHITLVWTAHTGTGNVKITGLPFTSLSGIDQPVSIITASVTFTNQIAARVTTNSTEIAIRTIVSGAGTGTVALPSAGTLVLNGFYFAA